MIPLSSQQQRDYVAILETWVEDYEKKYKEAKRSLKKAEAENRKLEKEVKRLTKQVSDYQTELKEASDERIGLKIQLRDVKDKVVDITDNDYVPFDEDDYKRYRKLAQQLSKDKQRLQMLVEDLKKENAELKKNKIYRVKGY